MRIIVILLLSLMLFFGGVTYGAKGRAITEKHVTEEIEETYPIIEVEEKEEVEVVEGKEAIVTIDPEEKEPVVNRTAGVLEKIVATFYDACIQVMYSFVSLFFD